MTAAETPPPGPLPLGGVLDDQRQRWRRGERVMVEAYLEQQSGLCNDTDAVLDLIYNEVLLRQERGESTDPEEYLDRFPHLAVPLRLLFEVDRGLDHATARWPTLMNRPGDAPGGERSPHTLLARPGEAPDPDRPPEPAGPPAVPGYQVVEVLGQGGMGVVWRASDEGLGRPVALKFLHPARAQDRDAVERFRREARIASALNHPHICTIHQLGEIDGRPFIAMELIEGQTLRALIGRRHAADALAGLFAQVARALAAGHAAGIVHRDVKPENVMVRPDGYVKVLDFGLARLLPAGIPRHFADPPADTDPGTVVGTVTYMSPEQARGEPVGSASDVFSLGIVVYELATGRHPFHAESGLGVLHAIATQPPVPPRRLNPELPEAVEALLLQLLEKDPRRRPTAAEVAAVLGEVAGSQAGPHAGRAMARPPRQTVGREGERAALWSAFEEAAAGRGLVLCVTGEPGIGKTTLVQDFLAELAADGRASVARGRCSERLAGTGAYLPVLEALEGLLRGEAGTLAARLMRELAPTWYVQVAPQGGDPSARAPGQAPASSQERMKREFLAFAEEMARLRPLVFFFDDLHWADTSTTDLLAYLGTRGAGMRPLVVATYRHAEMLASGHPFAQVQLELQRHGTCREVPLSFLSRADIASYLALVFPGHRFPADLPARLHAQTAGNPLFLVELLHHLRDQGAIAQAGGAWSLARDLPDFQRELPLSVRSLIQKQLARLDEDDRRLLAAAGVQGYEFDAAVVARVLGREAADVEERLEVLDRMHGLVRLVREQEFPDGTLTLRYQFVHVLYQNAVYASLRPARRAAWSAAAAAALLNFYGDQSAAVTGELALLFEAARDFARAADYYLLAARNAAGVYAHQEAVELARRGLDRLQQLPENTERDRRELRLQVTLGMQLQVTQGFAAAAAEPTYTRARALCRRLKENEPLFPVLWGLWLFHKVRSELRQARALAEQLSAEAGWVAEPALVLQSHQALAVTSLCLGEPAATRRHMEQGTALYDPRRHRNHTFLYGQDPGVACLAFGAVALWLLGYPEQAVEKSRQAVALGEELGQPSTLALALHFAAMLWQYRREPAAVEGSAEAALAIATDYGFSFWQAGGLVMRGWALAGRGAHAEGIAQLRQGLKAWSATGSVTYRTYYLALLAEALGQVGEAGEGLATLAESQALADSTGERLHQAELHRLRGELLLKAPGDGAEEEAEDAFRRALDVARVQSARSLELRAAMSLGRLYQRQGRPAEARPLLAETFEWFTEGHQTPDLREARELLEQLA